MSYADLCFVQTCKDILDHGFSDKKFDVRPHWEDGAPAHTTKLLNVIHTYDLSDGSVPIMTLRKTAFKNCIQEILWIWQKKSNNIKDLGLHIWDSWADEDGSIGKAYGYQLGVKYDFPEGKMDQVDWVLYQLRNNPGSRRILTNIFNHHDLKEMGLQPCAYSMFFEVTRDDDGNNILNGTLLQRSQDMLTANNWNTVQYAILLHMFARATGMKPGKFTHLIMDAHIYDRHEPIVREMIEKYDHAMDIARVEADHSIGALALADMIPHPNPQLWINPEVTDFYQFTVDDFKLIDYVHEPFDHKIEVAI